MDGLLRRVLSYLVGALYFDDSYIFCTWLIEHYSEIFDEDFTPERIMAETGIPRSSIDSFIGRLGKGWEWNDFLDRLQQDHITRMDQIRSRMIGLSTKDLVKNLEKTESDEEMLGYITKICEEIDKSERVFLIGGYYPLEIASEFQTDLVIYGKKVFIYHTFDPTIQFNERDLIIFISATGRSMNGFLRSRENQNPREAKSVLITQNPIYKKEEYQVSDWVIQMPGRFDGININYQIMLIFDLLRLHYYQQYYLGQTK